jgi:hypothetical protein
MQLYEGPQTFVNIALHGGLYLAILMDRYVLPVSTIKLPCLEAYTYQL